MSVIIRNSTKTSVPTGLTTGELALCNLVGQEKLYTKNSAGNTINLLDYSCISNKPTNSNYLSLTGGTISGDLMVTGKITAGGEISAFGAGSGTGSTSSIITTVNNSSGFGGSYADNDFTSTFNSAAINSLYLASNTNANNISTLNSTVSSLSSTVSTLNSNVSSLSSTVANLSGGTTSISGTYYNSSSGKYVYEGGYTILTSGLIWQWGRLSGDDGIYKFPLTFPHKCLSIQITTNRTSTGSLGANHAGNLTTSTFYAVLDATEGWFFAIGY
nr:hypothetical protein [uncultured Bacteroides sp.]